MAATMEAPRTPMLNTRHPKFSPRSDISAALIWPMQSRPAEAPPEANAAAPRDQHRARQTLGQQRAERGIPTRDIHKAMSYERMDKRAEELEAEVATWMDAAAAADASEDAAFGRDKSGEEMPAWVGDKKRRAEKIRAAKAELEAEARAATEAERKAGPRRTRSGKPKAARNPADPPPHPQKTRTRKRRRTSPIRKAAS